MTAVDEIRARAFGVQAGCPDCERLRSMDDLHRAHVSRLNAELGHAADFEADLFAEGLKARQCADRWKLIAWAGWAFAGMLMILETFSNGETEDRTRCAVRSAPGR